MYSSFTTKTLALENHKFSGIFWSRQPNLLDMQQKQILLMLCKIELVLEVGCHRCPKLACYHRPLVYASNVVLIITD